MVGKKERRTRKGSLPNFIEYQGKWLLNNSCRGNVVLITKAFRKIRPKRTRFILSNWSIKSPNKCKIYNHCASKQKTRHSASRQLQLNQETSCSTYFELCCTAGYFLNFSSHHHPPLLPALIPEQYPSSTC